MRVVILGGTGLIGRETAVRLRDIGTAVTMVSRTRPARLPDGIEWDACDITQPEKLQALVERVHPDAILHLAAFLQFACDRDPAQAIRINVDGTLNVLEACRIFRVPRVVFGSSIAVYGERSDLMREDEGESVNISLYGLTKRMGEALGRRYEAEHGIKFVALRYSGIFGPDEADGRVPSAGMALVRRQIKQCAEGQDIVIEGASGNECIHLTHVTDAVEATCMALLHPAPKHTVYNVAGPKKNYMTLREFHKAVVSLVPGAGRALWSGSARSAGPVDISRLQHDLNFSPSVSVIEGLRSDLAISPK